MGSVIGAVASYQQYQEQTEALEKAEARSQQYYEEYKAEKENAKKGTAATAQNPDIGDTTKNEYRKRKGVQSTFTAQESDTIGS